MSRRVKALAVLNVIGWLVAVPLLLLAVVHPFVDLGKWPNRLIGDKNMPEEKRIAWTSYDSYKKDSPLLPSGLLGPVRVRVGVIEEIK